MRSYGIEGGYGTVRSYGIEGVMVLCEVTV